MKTKDIYAHKPKSIETLDDLLAFAAGIPDNKWCSNSFKDAKGRCCINGHIGMAYAGDEHAHPNRTAGLYWTDLAAANNGGALGSIEPSSKKVKHNVINFIKGLLSRA
jgi:hypothetical protein